MDPFKSRFCGPCTAVPATLDTRSFHSKIGTIARTYKREAHSLSDETGALALETGSDVLCIELLSSMHLFIPIFVCVIINGSSITVATRGLTTAMVEGRGLFACLALRAVPRAGPLLLLRRWKHFDAVQFGYRQKGRASLKAAPQRDGAEE